MDNAGVWVTTVFKVEASNLGALQSFYHFVEDLKEVRSLHFLFRDRVDDEVVVSFRVLIDPKLKDSFTSKVTSKLTNLLPLEKFAIDPTLDHALGQYVAWNPKQVIAERGQVKFNQFVDLLKNMSANAVQMIEQDYFSSKERVELAHATSWMLGCTEYGALSPLGFEVGLYDRLVDKYCSYLKQEFKKEENKQ